MASTAPRVPSLISLCRAQLTRDRLHAVSRVDANCEQQCSKARANYADMAGDCEVHGHPELPEHPDRVRWVDLSDKCEEVLETLGEEHEAALSAIDADCAREIARIERQRARKKAEAGQEHDRKVAEFNASRMNQEQEEAYAAWEETREDLEAERDRVIKEARARCAAEQRRAYTAQVAEVRFALPQGSDVLAHTVCSRAACRQTFPIREARHCAACEDSTGKLAVRASFPPPAKAPAPPTRAPPTLAPPPAKRRRADAKADDADDADAGGGMGTTQDVSLFPCAPSTSAGKQLHPFFLANRKETNGHACNFEQCPFCEQTLCKRHAADPYMSPDFPWFGRPGREVATTEPKCPEARANGRACCTQCVSSTYPDAWTKQFELRELVHNTLCGHVDCAPVAEQPRLSHVYDTHSDKYNAFGAFMAWYPTHSCKLHPRAKMADWMNFRASAVGAWADFVSMFPMLYNAMTTALPHTPACERRIARQPGSRIECRAMARQTK